MASSIPPSPKTPKKEKIKPAQPGVPLFGCSHIKDICLSSANNEHNTISAYKDALRAIVDNKPTVTQTAKTSKGNGVTTLTPNFLCIQCDLTTTLSGVAEHGLKKSHRLYVESKNGNLFCQMCNDFVWDPTLEELRLRKLGAGTFSARKRKQDELFNTDVANEDPRFLSTNTVAPPCRASGLRGIYNMGATCYMNVILQSFVHNPLLRAFYLGEGHQSKTCPLTNCMSCAMDAMFQDFYAQESTAGFSAANILTSFYNSKRAAYMELASNQEQDAHEFFQFLTEELHDINSGTRESSQESSPVRMKISNEEGCKCVVHTTFYGKLQSTIKCQGCDSVRTSYDLFLDLSLGLDSIKKKGHVTTKLSLQECLDDEYKKAEPCDYSCTNCGSQKARKQLSIKSLPNVLCIQLKRFKQPISGPATKVKTKVSFPLKLEMAPYTNRARSSDKESFETARACTYDLQTVVVHVGAIDTGHYVSFSRVGNQWFKFNDHNVYLATKADVLGAEAFLLFYVIRALA